ncbi:MAG: hypothetical protein U0176_01785 [Bacteroidia bacterium]
MSVHVGTDAGAWAEPELAERHTRGILVDNATQAFASGRVDDMVDFRDGSVLMGVSTGGIWKVDKLGNSQNLTPSTWANIDVSTIERGTDSEFHVYLATSTTLYENRSPNLDNWTTINLPSGTTRVNDISILNGQRVILLGCNNGVFLSPIPNPLANPRTYTWTAATNGNATSNIHQMSVKSSGANWGALETINSESSSNMGMAVVNRSPVHRDIFYVSSNGTLRTAWNVLGTGWTGQVASITPTGAAHTSTDIAVVARGELHLDLFYAGPAGELKTTWWDNANGDWIGHNTNLQPAGTVASGSGIAAVSRTPNNLDVFYVTTDGSMRHIAWSSSTGAWTAPATVVGPGGVNLSSRIAVTARDANTLNVFWIDPSGGVRTNWWAQGVSTNWGNLYQLPGTGTASTGGGISAVARDQNKLDVVWVATDGRLMTTYWNSVAPEQWTGHCYALTAVNTAATTGRLSLVSRNPLQLDLFWKAQDGTMRTNYWNAYTGTNFASQSYSLGNHNGTAVMNCWASSAFDDEITLFYRTSSGIFAKRWTTNAGIVLVGGVGTSVTRGVVNGAGSTQLSLSSLSFTGGDGSYGTGAPSLSKYGTWAYCAISAPTAPPGYTGIGLPMKYVFKSTDEGLSWNAVAMTLENSTLPMNTQCGGDGGGNMYNRIAANPVDNNVVSLGYVRSFRSTNGGNTWRAPDVTHIHDDFHKLIWSDYDKSGRTLYYCDDGGLAATFDKFSTYTSYFNRNVPTLYCYTTDGARNFTGTLSMCYQVTGLMAVGTQDNGNNWARQGDSRWQKISPDPGGDGGYFTFIGDGSAVFRIYGGQPDPLARAEWTGTTLADRGDIPVTTFPPGASGPTTLAGGDFVLVNSPLPVAGTTSTLHGYGWLGANVYSYWSPSATQGWRFQYETAIPMATNEGVSAAGSPNGQSVFFGTSNGRMFRFDRIPGTTTVMTVNMTGVANAVDLGVNRICMLSDNLGYAIFTRWRNTTGGSMNEGHLFKWDGTSWTRLALALNGGGNIATQRLWGIDADWTVNPATLVMTTEDKVYMSTNAGATWSNQSNGLPTTNVLHLADVRFVSWPTLGRRFYIGTYGRSVWFTQAP